SARSGRKRPPRRSSDLLTGRRGSLRVPAGSPPSQGRVKTANPLILLARSEGFEPPTLGIEIRCSIQLSYERFSRVRAPARRRTRSGRWDAIRLSERIAKQKPHLTGAAGVLTRSC